MSTTHCVSSSSSFDFLFHTKYCLYLIHFYVGYLSKISATNRAFFLGGRRGTRTPKHFVNLMGESKNFKCWNSR